MTTCIASQMEAKTDAVNLFDCKDMDYDEIVELKEGEKGYFGACRKNLWGVITSAGVEVFPCKATNIYYVKNGRVICGMDDDVFSIKHAETIKGTVA